MRSRAWVGVCAGLVLGIGGTRAVAQGAKPEARPLLVGVIDVGVAFKEYKRKAALEAQVNEFKDELRRDLVAQHEKLQELRKGLDVGPSETDSYRVRKAEYLRRLKAYEVDQQTMEERLKARVESLTLRLLGEIEDMVKRIGDERGYDLVLKTDTQGWGDEKYHERIFRAQVGAVLHFKTALDITPEVLRLLNEPAHLEGKTFR